MESFRRKALENNILYNMVKTYYILNLFYGVHDRNKSYLHYQIIVTDRHKQVIYNMSKL